MSRSDNRARLHLTSLRALLEERRDESLVALGQLTDPVDPDGLFYVARALAYWREADRANEAFDLAVESGYLGAAVDRADSWVDWLNDDPRFRAMRERAQRHQQMALGAFQAAAVNL